MGKPRMLGKKPDLSRTAADRRKGNRVFQHCEYQKKVEKGRDENGLEKGSD